MQLRNYLSPSRTRTGPANARKKPSNRTHAHPRTYPLALRLPLPRSNQLWWIMYRNGTRNWKSRMLLFHRNNCHFQTPSRDSRSRLKIRIQSSQPDMRMICPRPRLQSQPRQSQFRQSQFQWSQFRRRLQASLRHDVQNQAVAMTNYGLSCSDLSTVLRTRAQAQAQVRRPLGQAVRRSAHTYLHASSSIPTSGSRSAFLPG